MICPICHGTGTFDEHPNNIRINKAAIKKEIALRLHKEGFSIRQIAWALDYKSPRSVSLHIHSDDQTTTQDK